MKKHIVSTLAAVLAAGAAATSFAAANPFSDVPRDHWAYDAVTQLAADGVIEGYGDGTYRGDRSMTRYEMAQMVARAMAKNDMSASDRAMLDRLAAEFADELNNLGVRVSNLERNADMIKWQGVMETTYRNNIIRGNGTRIRETRNQHVFRLEPTAEVNEHWKLKSRLEAEMDFKRDNSDASLTLKRIWAQGDYDNLQIKFGKFPSYNNDNLFDTAFSGAEVSFGKDLRGILAAGRLHTYIDELPVGGVSADIAGNYQYAALAYTKNRVMLSAAYHHLNSEGFRHQQRYKDGGTADQAHIWVLKGKYTFGNLALSGMYARNTAADHLQRAHELQLSYKGAVQSDPGSWGAWAAYRYLGRNVVFKPTYIIMRPGYQGWEIGAKYVPFKNVVASIRYGRGTGISGDPQSDHRKLQQFFSRLEVFF